jgi:hypothetical protein
MGKLENRLEEIGDLLRRLLACLRIAANDDPTVGASLERGVGVRAAYRLIVGLKRERAREEA